MRHSDTLYACIFARRISPTSKAEQSPIFDVYIRRGCTRVYGTRRHRPSKSNHKMGTCLSAEPENQVAPILPRNPSYTAKRKRHLYHMSISMSHKAQLCIKGGFIIYKHSRFAAVCRDYSIPKFCSAVAMLLNPGGLVGSATCTTNPASSDSKPSKVLDTYTHHCGHMYGTECIMLML